MICDEKKFIFLHIPKNGGSCIDKHFFNLGLTKSWTGAQIHSDVIHKQKAENYFIFAFHRNPFDRMVSIWKYWTEKNKVWAKKILEHYPDCSNFRNFCENFYNVPKILRPYEIKHFICQCRLNQQPQYVKVNFWGRFSNLDEDFETICSLIDVPYKKLEYVNNTIHEHYTTYYDDNTKKIVSEIFKEDIEYFNYKFGD